MKCRGSPRLDPRYLIAYKCFWKRLSAEEAEVVRGSHAYGRGREPARVFRFLARLETCRRPLPHNMIKGPTCYVLDTRPGPRRNPLGTPLLRCSFGSSKFDTAQVVSGRFDSIRPRKSFKVFTEKMPGVRGRICPASNASAASFKLLKGATLFKKFPPPGRPEISCLVLYSNLPIKIDLCSEGVSI
ncbi:unnamed protein product [Nesidiocoris tenuis]|uniref:Uncharacterized protein n=1 Tax=Nesidiocoris tenuis TaxID=355587 RepID=A0A6H5H3I4_9HEMI|nr:unnamed protein product [Nesidiocoris tenuis]